MSPELIAPEEFGSKKSRPTKASDCYALGMVVYETISGNIPFHEHADLAVFVKVLKGDRPTRRARFMNDLWKMLESCWAPQPNDRPSIEDVLQCLEAVSTSSEAPLGVDEETEGYSDQDSGSSLPSVSHDYGANTASVPDLSRLSVEPFAHLMVDQSHPEILFSTRILPYPAVLESQAATFPPNWRKIPQEAYNYGRRQWDFTPSETIFFSVNGRPGVNVGDALRKAFADLDGRDDQVLQNMGSSISCRLSVGLPR